MIRLIKSDFYKLFRMKSFYICGLLAAALSGALIWLLDFAARISYSNYYGIGEEGFVSPYTGIFSFTLGLSSSTVFVIILSSMFVQSEFKFGTMKNIVSAGLSREKIYLSKYVIMVFISVVYALVCGLSAFGVGCAVAGTGEFTRAVFLDMLEVFGLFLLAQVALQSVFQMVSFVSRSTGWAITVNLLIYMFLAEAFKYIDLFVNNWLADAISSVSWLNSWIKIENFSIGHYWPLRYISGFTNIDILHMDFFQEILTTGIIVCVVYIVVTSILGALIFKKRDID